MRRSLTRKASLSCFHSSCDSGIRRRVSDADSPMRGSPVAVQGSSGERTEYRNRVFPIDERRDQPLHSSRSAGAGLHLRGGTPPVSPLGYNFRTGMMHLQFRNAGHAPECLRHSRGFFLPLEKSPNWPLFRVACRYVTTNQDGHRHVTPVMT